MDKVEDIDQEYQNTIDLLNKRQKGIEVDIESEAQLTKEAKGESTTSL